MTEISMDFDGLRISALRKAIQISGDVDRTTIGPNSTTNDMTTATDNIENSKNTCNIESSKKSPKSQKSRSSVTFSVEKLRHENEIQRREEVQKAIDKRKHDMELFENKLHRDMELMRNELIKKREREMEEERIRFEAEEERFAQQDELKQRHEAQLQAQRLQERKEKLEREAIEHRKFQEHQDCLIKITKIKSNFTDKCKEIAQLAKTIKNKNSIGQIIGQFTTKLREFSQQIDTIIEYGRNNNLTINNISKIDDIISQTDEIYEICKTEVTKANEIYDEIIRREESKLKNQESINNVNNSSINSGKCEIANPDTPPNELIENNSESSSTETIDDGNNDNYFHHIYGNSLKFLEQYQSTYSDFVNSNATIKFQNECNKSVNFLTKKIAPTSGAHLREVLNDFVMLFEGKKPPFVNQCPQGLAFCKNLVAEIFIEQVEDSFVRRNTKWIYALAAITVSLWAEYPDVGELILAHLRINCPYIVPVLLPRYQGQSAEDFYKSRGYKYTDGVRENEDEFIQRMSNLVKFYAAIIVTNVSTTVNKPHPHGVGYAWRWIAGILNSEPQHDAVKIYARVIKDMLEISGNAMWNTYPKQFPKLLMVLAQDYYPLLQRYEGDSNFAMSPLRDFLNDAITTRSIPPPDGQLPPNFW